jgi:hypothetical protein
MPPWSQRIIGVTGHFIFSHPIPFARFAPWREIYPRESPKAKKDSSFFSRKVAKVAKNEWSYEYYSTPSQFPLRALRLGARSTHAKVPRLRKTLHFSHATTQRSPRMNGVMSILLLPPSSLCAPCALARDQHTRKSEALLLSDQESDSRPSERVPSHSPQSSREAAISWAVSSQESFS